MTGWASSCPASSGCAPTTGATGCWCAVELVAQLVSHARSLPLAAAAQGLSWPCTKMCAADMPLMYAFLCCSLILRPACLWARWSSPRA